jgi:hypothetical protein
LTNCAPQIGDARGELNDLYAQITAASQAPPDPSYVERELAKAIDAVCDSHSEALVRLIEPYLKGRENAEFIGHGLTSAVNNAHLRDSGLLALLRDALKNGISGELSRMQWPANALTDSERQRRLDELEPDRIR